MVVARIIVQHGVERVHGHRDGRVADGVNTELPAELVAFFDVGVDLLRREKRPAAESRLAFVIHQRPRGRAGESAIGHHFADRSDAQALVAVAGLAAEFLQLRGALFGLPGSRRISDLNGRARQIRAVLFVQKFPLRIRADDIGMNRGAGFDHAGDAELELLAHVLRTGCSRTSCGLSRGTRRVYRSFRSRITPFGSPFASFSIRPRSGFGRGLVDVGHFERLAVADGAMATGAREHHRVVGRRRVQIAAQRLPLFGEMILVPVAAGDPFAGTQFLRLLAHLLLQLEPAISSRESRCSDAEWPPR